MKWKWFVVINLICMLTVAYFSWHLGLAQGKSACIKEYFAGTIQAEEKFIIETINLVICESNNKHDGVWGDNGKAYGRFQFWKIGFYDLVEKTGNQDLLLNWQNSTDQYFIYKEAYKIGEVSQKWTCYKPVDF